MRVLVIGSGGREHAICWRLARSPRVSGVLCAPGNPGTAACGTNLAGVGADDLDGIVAAAADHGADLTVVGPEAPLCAGIRERFERRGLRVVGPSARAARLEGSKAFAKEFMARRGIPSAPFGVFDDIGAAERYIDAHPEALVVKADGLAAGKGVFVCADARQARDAARSLLVERALGGAGARIVVERRLRGEEGSYIVMCDGERVVPLATSQDHKAALDNDEGPNTGGMGAYSPAPVLDAGIQQRVLEGVVMPTVEGLAAEGAPYRGFLYVGLMVCGGEPTVLEYNCRLGDPETQPLMARFDDDIVPYLEGMADGALPRAAPRWDPRAAVCVVMAAGGYPGPYDKGLPIEGLQAPADGADDLVVFHAGTARSDGGFVTAGGRVLGVTGLGDGVEAARARAYEAVRRISWPGAHFRTDIAARGSARAAARPS